MKTVCTITIRVRVAWWFHPYVKTLAFFAWLMQSQPDMDKFHALVMRATSIEVEQ